MSDLISRKAAIDAVASYLYKVCLAFHSCMTHEESKECATLILQPVPSAQPEIIRCKECRWGREACGNIECFVDSNNPTEYYGYEWFCPNGERKDDGSN